MPTARHGIQAAVCNGGVYIAGGGTTQGGGAPTAFKRCTSKAGRQPAALTSEQP